MYTWGHYHRYTRVIIITVTLNRLSGQKYANNHH